MEGQTIVVQTYGHSGGLQIALKARATEWLAPQGTRPACLLVHEQNGRLSYIFPGQSTILVTEPVPEQR